MRKVIALVVGLIIGGGWMSAYLVLDKSNIQAVDNLGIGEGTITRLNQFVSSSTLDAIVTRVAGTDLWMGNATITVSRICLTGDTCETTWPAGGGGGGGSISTSTAVTAGNLAYWTSSSELSQVATGTLTETAAGLELSATRGLVGGSSVLSVSSGFNIPLSASTTNWNGFYNVPSTRITAGTGIDWSGNTLNGVYTAGDALTLTGEDFDFDGGTSPGGELGGTWPSPTIDDSLAVTSWNLTTPTLTSFFGTPCTGNDFLQDIGDTGTFTCGTAVGGGGGLATSSPVSTSNLLYYASNGTAKGVATTTVSGNSQIALSNAIVALGGSASVLSIVGDSIGDSQLAFDTGQTLTTVGTPTFGGLTLTPLTSALLLTNGSGVLAEYTGSGTCTNQFLTVLSALGVGTCASVTTSAISDGTITEPDLDADNSPNDTDYLQYDSTGTNFIWRSIANVVADLETDIETALDTLTSLVTVAISTTLAIPSGTACDSNADGEICQDTTDNQLIVDGSAIPTTGIKIVGRTVASTSSAFLTSGLMPLTTQLDGFTITRIQCTVDTGTSKVIAIEDASGNASEDITCATTNTTDDGSITNATYTASEEWYIDFGATSGSVDYVSISVFGNWTRE
jgi:hypothetical protein